jgi:hypothetical protein
MIVARLGEGKWHKVEARRMDVVFTACSIALKPFASSLRIVTVAIADGKPTCKTCKRKVGMQ